MSGHSHWAGIKHKKEKEDRRRGKVFSKLAKRIMSAARHGGADPDNNLELQYAIEEAKAANMPKDKIERAVLKATGQLGGVKLESVRYEGYGCGGAAIMVNALTDNRNRTGADVRRIFDKHGGKLGASGCVGWIFQTKGLLLIRLHNRSEEETFEIAVDAGAEDFQQAGEVYELTCDVADLQAVKAAVERNDIPYETAEITEVPQSYVDLNVADGRKVLALMGELEDHPDVASVYSNLNLAPELVAELEDETE